jgi:hypothetical protein
MKVESPLDIALAEAVTKTVDSIDTAAGFLAAQAPEVISQLLLWHGIRSALMCVLGIVILYALQHLARSCTGPGDKIDHDSELHRNNHLQTLTHDGNGEWCPRVIGTVFAGSLGIVMGIDLTISNLDWLQILVAEKIWLLEYAAKIIKK